MDAESEVGMGAMDGEELESDPAYEEAMELNRRLKEALEATEAGDQEAALKALGMMPTLQEAAVADRHASGARRGGGGGGRGGGRGAARPRGSSGGRGRGRGVGAGGGGGGGSAAGAGAGAAGGARMPPIPGRKPLMPTSAPPAAIKPATRSNYTFSEDRLSDIGKGNQRLLDSLYRISSGPSSVPKPRPSGTRPPVAKQTSAAINRKKKNSKIDTENAAFLRRLQSIKPTMPRDKMRKEAQKQKRLARLRSNTGVVEPGFGSSSTGGSRRGGHGTLATSGGSRGRPGGGKGRPPSPPPFEF